MAMLIYLIGYMASGKSQFGQQLSLKLGFEFIDLDQFFEERFRISVPDFFEKYDESAFRQIEHKLLLETTTMDNIVVSTGGGTPCFFDNMQIIKNAGYSIYLKWEIALLAQRLKKAKRKRPLLKNVPDAKLEEKVQNHLEERRIFYEQADFILLAGRNTTDQLLDQIVSTINSFFPKL